MVSISSSKLIRERTRNFCSKISNWEALDNNIGLFKQIDDYLKEEYDLIPDKERIGKGIVYISKYVAKEMVIFIKNEIEVDKKYFLNFTEKAFSYGEDSKSHHLMHFALYILSEFVFNFPDDFVLIIPLVKKYADHNDWPIRESTGSSLLMDLKKCPDKTIKFLKELMESDNANLRRIVSESSRPIAIVKWLRDPTKNDKILEILTILRKDPSIYVRKSVGNNIKDLTKYMPEKILELMESWIKTAKIKIHDEIATEVDLNKDDKNLIWTMKHAMRWIKERNPEYHDRLEKILGKNYLLYFNEKSNRLAKPKK